MLFFASLSRSFVCLHFTLMISSCDRVTFVICSLFFIYPRRLRNVSRYLLATLSPLSFICANTWNIHSNFFVVVVHTQNAIHFNTVQSHRTIGNEWILHSKQQQQAKKVHHNKKIAATRERRKSDGWSKRRGGGRYRSVINVYKQGWQRIHTFRCLRPLLLVNI